MRLALTLFFFCSGLFASDIWLKGSGSEFQLSTAGSPTQAVWVYVSESTDTKVGVEMYFSMPSLLGGENVELWLQSHFGRKEPPILEASYLMTSAMNSPEKVDLLAVRRSQGLGMGDFLFLDEKKLASLKVGEETVETPAGKVRATHYRSTSSEQTLDYWISEQAKPIGLVKLESRGTQVFSMSLKRLVRNVASKISPAAAGPASPDTIQLLNLSGGSLPLVP
ncbi:MAG: hypothetical protein KDD51_16190 [Bdellovibrionales bacterium]|nr:hypothetical protein [Bdellovibrionales bacterium]